MIEGFEQETAPLTEYERNTLLPAVARELEQHIGAENAIANTSLHNRLSAYGYEIGPSRLRKIIHHIRINGLVPRLIATGRGYHISIYNEELDSYIDSLKGREAAIRRVREAMMEQRATLI